MSPIVDTPALYAVGLESSCLAGIPSKVGHGHHTNIFLVFLSFFRAAYTLYLFSYRQHGSYYFGIYRCLLGYSREFLLLFSH
jgi:NADH-ubiquinone oxidoreductase chain 4